MLSILNSILYISTLLTQVSAIALPDSKVLRNDNPQAVALTFKVEKDLETTLAAKRNDITLPLKQDNFYLVDLELGSEKELVQLALDTGSSDLVVVDVSAGGIYNSSKSSTFNYLGFDFENIYGLGYYYGHWVLDSVFIGDSVELKDFQFGDAITGTGIRSGSILGIGPKGKEGVPEYPNFPYALKDGGFIDKVGYSLYLSEDADSGTILFGAVDTAKYEGELAVRELTIPGRTAIQVDSIVVDGHNLSTPFNATLDSGSALTTLPPEHYKLLESQLAEFHGKIPDKSLKYGFGNVVIRVPYSEIYRQDADSGEITLTVTPTTESFYLNILGDDFLRHAYVVFNLEDEEISLAPVNYTDETNIVSL